MLKHIQINEHLRYLELQVYDSEWHLLKEKTHEALQHIDLSAKNEILGQLSWQAGLPQFTCYTNFAQMLSRALYFNHAQRQQQQLLLMERSIMREIA